MVAESASLITTLTASFFILTYTMCSVNMPFWKIPEYFPFSLYKTKFCTSSVLAQNSSLASCSDTLEFLLLFSHQVVSDSLWPPGSPPGFLSFTIPIQIPYQLILLYYSLCITLLFILWWSLLKGKHKVYHLFEFKGFGPCIEQAVNQSMLE